jgi:hypothetical protein
VRASDAAGFGPGPRTRRWVDWPRVVAWFSVGALATLAVGGIGIAAYGL